MALGSGFLLLRDSPEGSSKRRLILFGAIGVTCLLLIIHHIRLEVAARHSSTEVAARNTSLEEAFGSRLANLESRYEATVASLGWQDCGGYVPLHGERDLIFQVPPNGLPHGCVWIIAAKAVSGPITIRRVQDDHFRFNDNFILLVVNNRGSGSCTGTSLRTTSGEQTYTSGVIMVFFHGQSFAPGEGFRLKITDGSQIAAQKHITFLRQQNSFTHKYPPGYSSRYGDNKIFLLLGEASQEKKVNVTISGIHTEATADYVSLMWVDPSQSSRMFCQTRSGPQRSNIQAVIPTATPFLIFFSSDGGVAGEGFNVRATYYE